MERDIIVVKVPHGNELYLDRIINEISKETGAFVVILPHEVDMLFDERARDTLDRLHEEIHKILEKEE